tara:strand:+ start:2665 stop:3642 length:978 start_codon:yes stop_codon:yes gene_type:complete
MSTYDEFYANSTTDLELFLPNIGAFDRQVLITGWVFYQSNIYRAGTGTVESCYRDSFDLGDPVANLSTLISNDTDGQWFYSDETLYLRSDNNPLTHHTIEAGRSYSTLKTTALSRAASFIRNYINRPIHKRLGVGVQGSSESSWDDLIIKANAALACAELARPYDPERADYLESLAHNEAGTGWLDKIKSGEVSLWHDKTSRHNQGIVKRVSINSNSTSNIIDVRGHATADDLIKVIVSAGGTLTKGTANTSVKYSSYVSSSTGLQTQAFIENEPINGGYQNIGHGLQAQWSYGVTTTNDFWEVVCSGSIPEAGSPVRSIQLERR